MSEDITLDEPLTQQILKNPDHPITRHLLYIYSMETFVYQEMNTASRNRDKFMIQYYGGFAAALSYILRRANKQRKDQFKIKGVNKFYRGLRIEQKDLETYQSSDGSQPNIVYLKGFTSSSRSKETALNFALMQKEEPMQSKQLIPVLMEINFIGDEGIFDMCCGGYSAFENEDEVLI